MSCEHDFLVEKPLTQERDQEDQIPYLTGTKQGKTPIKLRERIPENVVKNVRNVKSATFLITWFPKS